MSDHDDRGSYAPRNDEPLAFDARRPTAGGGGPAPTMLIISALVLVAMIVAAVLFYRSGIRRDGDAPRVVGEPVGELATAPSASAQPADGAEKLDVYGAEGAPVIAAEPTFAPAPEEPVARARPAVTRPAPAAPAAGEVDAAPVAPAPKPAPPQSPPVAESPAPVPAPVRAGGGAAVQIGAFSSPSQADKGWNDAARANPGGMAGKGKRVEQVDVGGATFHRTFVTGFATRAEAQKFCADLKSAGKSCIVR